MKKGLGLAMASLIALLVVPVELQAWGGRHLATPVDECDECADNPVISEGVGGFGHGAFAPSARHFAGRPMPAPVYFANTFPEYINGAPNIFAGYEEDTVYLGVNRGRSPFRYHSWDKAYQRSDYGVNWDKNWTPTGNKGSVSEGSIVGAPAAKGATYSTSNTNGSYEQGYIANFDTFCNMEMVRPAFPCLSRIKSALGFLFHGPCCLPSYGYPCYDPCFDPCCDICGDPCANICVADPCCVPCAIDCCDSCGGGYQGYAVESCCGQGDTVASPEPAVNSSDATPAPVQVPSPGANSENNSDSASPAGIPAADRFSNEVPKTTFSTDISVPNLTPPATNQGVSPIPKLDRPAAPNGELPLPPAAKPEGTTGVIRMTVPEDSVVFINGYQTKMTGADRQFAARNLVPGEVYRFEVKVIAKRNGELYSDVQNLFLPAGSSMDVAFHLSRNDETKVALK